MELNNCLYCCVHKDTRKLNKCICKTHKFKITEKFKEKYERDIVYIKKEVKGGRHIIASLGSAGYTFLDDIQMLANYAYGIGDKKFYEKIK